jgi:hypothetical protein
LEHRKQKMERSDNDPREAEPTEIDQHSDDARRESSFATS